MQRLSLSFFSLISGFLLCAFCVLYVANEDPVYVWDAGGYQQTVGHLSHRFQQSLGDFAIYVLATVYQLDYNAVFALPLLPFRLLLGEGRTVYILSVVLVYVLPVTFLLIRFSLFATASGASVSDNATVAARQRLAVFMGFLYWPLWMAVMAGWPDVAGALPLGLATFVFVRSRYLTVNPIPNGMLLGFLLWGAFLLRRWYAFSIVSLLVITGLFCLYLIIKSGKNWKTLLSAAVQGYVAIALVMVSFLQFFQKGLITRILETSYANAYEGYQRPFVEHLERLYAYIGPVVLLLVVLGVVRAVWQRHGVVVLCTLAPCLTFFLFSFTQAPGIQHFIPTVFWFFVPAFYGASWLLEKGKVARIAVLSVLPVVMLASFLNVFSPVAWRGLSAVHFMLPSFLVHPVHVEKLDEYRRLIADLKAALASVPDAKMSVFASSGHLCDDLLTAIDSTIDSKIVGVADADARDGFIIPTLRAEFTVVTDKPALHLIPHTQQVVSVPNNEIFAGTGVGEGYARYAGPYVVAGGYTAYIYRRTRPVTDQDIQHLLDLFRVSYPDWTLQPDDSIFTKPANFPR